MESLKKIVIVAGLILVVLGGLLTWRGFTTAIPVMGLVQGGVYAVAGIAFFVLGLALLIGPPLSRHRKAKKIKDEAKLRAKIEKELKK